MDTKEKLPLPVRHISNLPVPTDRLKYILNIYNLNVFFGYYPVEA